jgi:hypothetical protein
MVRLAAVAVLFVALGPSSLVAQELARYREYALGARLASVVTLSGAHPFDIETLHERPATIQSVRWRAPYGRAPDPTADSVRELSFSFYDDQLYRIVVTYDRERMEGLTDDDVIGALSTTDGPPAPAEARTARLGAPPNLPADALIAAQWEDGQSQLTLTRGYYSRQLQLVLVSKMLTEQALAAVTEALALERQEAARRAQEEQEQDAADARAAAERTRTVNKGTFRP